MSSTVRDKAKRNHKKQSSDKQTINTKKTQWKKVLVVMREDHWRALKNLIWWKRITMKDALEDILEDFLSKTNPIPEIPEKEKLLALLEIKNLEEKKR